MSWTVRPSAASHHLLLRASAGEQLPDALSERLKGEGVRCGWLRASGVVADVELRAYDGDLGALGSSRRIAGPVQLLSVEGSIGFSEGEPSFSMRAVLARETDRGLEVIAGEIAAARVVAFEALVTVLDDVALDRALDTSAGVWMLGHSGGGGPARAVPRAPEPRAAPTAWSSALEASDHVEPAAIPRARTSAGSGGGSAAMPMRPARPGIDLDTPYPEPNDLVEHFAFGRGEVLKGDGDRLHVKMDKDGRIREIAMSILKVTRLDDAESGKRRFRLERKM